MLHVGSGIKKGTCTHTQLAQSVKDNHCRSMCLRGLRCCGICTIANGHKTRLRARRKRIDECTFMMTNLSYRNTTG